MESDQGLKSKVKTGSDVNRKVAKFRSIRGQVRVGEKDLSPKSLPQ